MPPCRSSILSSFLSILDEMRMILEGFGCSFRMFGVVFAAVCAGVNGLLCVSIAVVGVVLVILVVAAVCCRCCRYCCYR